MLTFRIGESHEWTIPYRKSKHADLAFVERICRPCASIYTITLQAIAHVVVGLKTTKGTKTLKLDPQIYESIQKEKVGLAPGSRLAHQDTNYLSCCSQVSVGDVIYIESNSGAVKRVGRSDA